MKQVECFVHCAQYLHTQDYLLLETNFITCNYYVLACLLAFSFEIITRYGVAYIRQIQ